ncbi:MAG: hypothetical protein ACXVVQ_12035 [Solirubrobacteraceae bacterium]
MSVDEARFLASFFACLSTRRSRSLLSRLSFAIVVFFFPREAMDAVPLLVEDATTGIRKIDTRLCATVEPRTQNRHGGRVRGRARRLVEGHTRLE